MNWSVEQTKLYAPHRGAEKATRPQCGKNNFPADWVMFSVPVCLSFLAAAVLVWGTYSGLKKRYITSIDSISFAIVYVFGQFVIALIVWLATGAAFPEDMMPSKIACVIMGGFIVLFAEYLFFAVSQFLNPSIAMACLSVQYVFGVILNYFISKDGVRLKYLVLGSVVGFCGLASLIITAYVKKEEQEEGTLTPISISDVENFGMASVELRQSKCVDKDEDEEEGVGEVSDLNSPEQVAHFTDDIPSCDRSDPLNDKGSSFWFWIANGLFAGVICASYSVLPAIGQSGRGSVKNPATLLLLFQIGQVISLPVVVFVFGHTLTLTGAEERVTSVASVLRTLWAVPTKDKGGSVFIGMLVSLGYAGYFFGSSGGVPVSVAFALMMSVVLVSTLCGLTCFGEYKRVAFSSPSYPLIVAGSLLYAGSICIFILLAF